MKYLLVLMILCGYNITLAQNTAKFTRDIDSLVYQYLIENNIPSVAVGIVHRDTVIYESRIINYEVERVQISEQEKSIYNIASVAKPFVATAIMQLVQEGKVDLQAPVVRYLPYFKINSKFQDQITIEHLLTHTSGLPNVSSPDDYKYLNVDLTDDALENHIKSLSDLKLMFKPGKKHEYSNVGFEILGDVIAKVTNKPFEEYMRTSLFVPLKMNRTSYLLSDFQENEIAPPYVEHPYKKTEKFPYNRQFSPSGNLFTSVQDMNHWMIFNLNNGVYEGFKPLTDENYNLLTKPLVNTEDDEFVGLSWFVQPDRAGGIVFHDGLDLGYSALMILFKSPQIGIFVMSNHLDTDCNALVNKIAKSIKY